MLREAIRFKFIVEFTATAEPSPEESFRFCKYESHVICQILLERLGASNPCKLIERFLNESPPDQKIPFHHEMAQVPEFPSKLFFYCEVEPNSGGETPLVLSHVVYERMKEKHPEFVQRLEEHGLVYVRVLGEDDDPSSPIGRGWKSTFLTHDKNVAEERAAKLGMKLEWTEEGGAKTVMGPIPAIKFDESRNRKVWFNSMVAAYTWWEDKRNDPRKTVTFGDWEPLPKDIVHDCLRILEEECVAVPWQRGDVLLIDNWGCSSLRVDRLNQFLNKQQPPSTQFR
uniref:TauD/TfdA-like domain-containing protein n=1 Tax=Brassica campestris TaxID=3711 RepID=A0A3P6CJA1_BRACM|nr:unnamed protein product [Brassica rapa]